MSVVGGLLQALSVKPITAFSSAMCFRNNTTRSEWGMTWGIFESKSAAPRRPFSKSAKKPDTRTSYFKKKICNYISFPLFFKNYMTHIKVTYLK